MYFFKQELYLKRLKPRGLKQHKSAPNFNQCHKKPRPERRRIQNPINITIRSLDQRNAKEKL